MTAPGDERPPSGHKPPVNDSTPTPLPDGRSRVARAGKPGTAEVSRDRLPRPARPPALIEFQPDALEIEDRPPPRASRVTLYSVAAFLVAATVWAAVSEIDQRVTAEGKLVTRAPKQVIQPLETAVIRSVDVAPGDVVKAGQRLATLDPTFTDADAAQVEARRTALGARMARLAAEIEGVEFQAGALHGAEGRLQESLFRQRRAHVAAQLRKYEEDIARAGADLETNRSGQAMLAKRVAVLVEVEDMRRQLYANQTGSRLNLLEARALRLEIESDLEQMRREETELHHTMEGIRADRQAFLEDFRRAAIEEMSEAKTEYDGLTKEAEKARYRSSRITLTAPRDAIVLDMAERAVGSVIREAEPLLTLVPIDDTLEAEVMVATQDIGRVSEGQTVRVKLAAFPFQKHGTATGELRMVSGDAFAGEDETQPPHYKARVALTDVALRDVPPDFRLLPGMTVTAEINAGHRTVLSYFLYPLLRGLDEGVREP